MSSDKAFDLAEKLDHVSGAQQEQASSVSISALRAVACEALPNVVIAFTGTPAAALQCLAEAALPHRGGVAVAGLARMKVLAGKLSWRRAGRAHSRVSSVTGPCRSCSRRATNPRRLRCWGRLCMLLLNPGRGQGGVRPA